MFKLSKKSMVQTLSLLLVLAVIAKALGVGLLLFLPKKPLETSQKNMNQSSFYRMNFDSMIDSKKENHREKRREDIISMQDFLLHGLYGNTTQGYAIISAKKSPQKTEIISVGQSYKGFKLNGVFLNYVEFVKGGKKYRLFLQGNQKVYNHTFVRPNHEQRVDDEPVSVDRSDIAYYRKNIAQIWKDVSIKEIGINGNLQGFVVKSIRKNSKIANLGLQKGDIILEVNGKKLKSYGDVLQIYRNIDKIDMLKLLVKRGNSTKEIVYEIY